MAAWIIPAEALPLRPALWEARVGAGRVLLFGDNPAQRTPWRSENIESSVRASNVFWTETPHTGSDSAKLFIAKGVDPSRPLASWLTPRDWQRVSAAAASVGMGVAGLERLRPWLAAILLEQGFNARAGFRPENAPAHVLAAVAEKSGVRVASEFADTAAIVDFFAAFSPAAEVGALLRAVGDIEAGAGASELAGKAWATGDQRPELAGVLHLRAAYPAYYQRILVERNRRWRTRIEAMLGNGDNAFVLVGDYHLVGPDSIQRQLASIGVATRRI
ncbi:MAG TPA: TraB/GumN family protein [Caulobacteraceae bacterium]|jgi:hypothetical protein|nr:TraB/GumN family protein [Caulobacteraceae bacterium]